MTFLIIKYDPFVIMLLHESNKITFDKVYVALYNNEKQKKDQKEYKTTSAWEAYTVRGCTESCNLGEGTVLVPR